jgi:hypothetical protein
MSSLLKYGDINLQKIYYSKPEKIGSSYFGSLSYDQQNQPIYIQTTKVKSLTDAETIQDKKNPYLEFEILEDDYNLYDFFLSLDNQNINETVKHSKEWFGKEIPLEAIDDMYTRITKPYKKNENPKIKIKIPVIKNKIQCGVYNQNKVFVNFDEIKKGSELTLVIHLRGLKVLKKYFYCDCYISQIKLYQSPQEKFNILKDYSFVDEEEEEDLYGDIFNQEIKESLEENINEQLLKKKKQEEEKMKVKRDTIQKLEDEIKQKYLEIGKINSSI